MTSVASDRRNSRVIGGTWLNVAHAVIVLALAASLVLAFAGMPLFIDRLSERCPAAPCNNLFLLTDGEAETLAEHGLGNDAYIAYQVALQLGVVLAFAVVGLTILAKRSSNLTALLAALLCVTWLITPLDFTDALRTEHTAWRVLQRTITAIGTWVFLMTYYLFPNGRFDRKWIAVLAGGWTVACVIWLIAPRAPFNPFPGSDLGTYGFLVFVAWTGSGIAAQVTKLRSSVEAIDRLRIGWVLVGIVTAFVSGLIRHGLPEIPATNESEAARVIWLTLGLGVAALLLVLFPISIGASVLYFRLWDMNVTLRRRAMHIGLGILGLTTYTGIVGIAAAVISVWFSTALTALFTAIFGLALLQTRANLRRFAERLTYGRRDRPLEVLTEFGRTLEVSGDPRAVLRSVIETIGEGINAPRARIYLRADEDGPEMLAAEYVSRGADVFQFDPSEVVELPLVYQGDRVGNVTVWPRRPGERYTDRDELLLENIARQAGPAARAVQLFEQLQRTIQELRLSRARLVTAQESVRQQIATELHGTIQGQLVAASISLRQLVKDDSNNGDTGEITSIVSSIDNLAQNEIRELSHRLHPAIVRMGLVPSIESLCDRYTGPLDVSLNIGERLRAFDGSSRDAVPIGVRLALYRVTEEAFNNVAKHVGDCNVTVNVELDPGGEIVCSVKDDGPGFETGTAGGLGLATIKDYASFAGGEATISSAPGSGTVVEVRVPLSSVNRQIDHEDEQIGLASRAQPQSFSGR